MYLTAFGSVQMGDSGVAVCADSDASSSVVPQVQTKFDGGVWALRLSIKRIIDTINVSARCEVRGARFHK